MPLSDGYQTEKDLLRDGHEISVAITDYLNDMGLESKRGFILFICDLPTGLVQFQSDLDRVTSTQILEMWLKDLAGASNAQDSEGAQPITEQTNNNKPTEEN